MKYKTLQFFSIICILLTSLGLSALAVSAQEPTDLDQEVENVTIAQMLDTRATRTFSLYRGSWALWSRDSVRFTHGNGRVTSSNGFQDWGWVFPNYIEGRGITRVQTSASFHIWRGRKYVAAGIPTPWGHVGVHGKTVTDHLRVNSNGTASWW